MSNSWKIEKLLINGLPFGYVTDEKTPVFSITASGDGDDEAASVRLIVKNGDVTFWDSGDMPFTTPHYAYAGSPLYPKTCYYVELTATSVGGETATQTASLQTGFLDGEWRAKWIEPVQEKVVPEERITFFEQLIPKPEYIGGHARLHPVQELKRMFDCKTPPQRAMLYASARGVYELSINGETVDGRLLAPETTSYEFIQYYQSYDVAQHLKIGENELRVLLADGWWAGRIGLAGASCQFGDTLGFIMELDLEFSNGERREIYSDGEFLARPSYIKYSDLFMGEKWDMTAAEEAWQPVGEVDHSTKNLVAQSIAPVYPLEEIKPVAVFKTPEGELVCDFGQVTSGVPRVTVAAKTSMQITFDFCEVLNERGNFYRNIIGRNKDQSDVLICPPGTMVFRPKFTYHGFRYMRVTGADEGDFTDIRAIAIGTRLNKTGEFFCSDERLNQLQRNIINSFRANLCSVPTDCPQREKMGWTGDTQVAAKTAAFNFDVLSFLRGWLACLRSEQNPDGSVRIFVPSYHIQNELQLDNGAGTSSAWGDACILVPYYLYQSYGDKIVLRENLDMMRGWLRYIASASENNLWIKGHHFGDWLIPSLSDDHDGISAGTQRTKNVISSSFYAVTVRAYLGVLDALLEDGYDELLDTERRKYTELLPKIKTAVRREYILPDGSVKGDLQGLYVIVLYAEIVEGELRDKVAKRLAELIENNGDRLDTGFTTTSYLLDVLKDTGYLDIAYKLLFQTKCPSWLYQVEQGATTIWERWNALRPDGSVTESSFNHFSLGSVGDWIYRNIGGIAVKSPGYKAIKFAPDIHCGLTYSACELDSPYGKIICNWQWQGSTCKIDLHVPPNTTAELVLGAETHQLNPGNHSFQASHL